MKKANYFRGYIKGGLMTIAAVLAIAGGTITARAQDLSAAVDISAGAEVQGVITESNEENYFKYTAGAAGYVNFSVKPAAVTTSNPHWELELFDKDGVKVCGDSGNNPVTRNVMVEAGSLYYIKVTNYYSARDIAFNVKANYTAFPAVIAEPNSAAVNAKAVALGTEYLGIIEKSDDEDFLKITAPKAGYVKMDLKRYTLTSTELPEWEFTVYDSSMNELYSINSKFQDDAHNTEGVYYVLDKNKTIYVKINKNNSTAVGELYSFKAEFSANKFVEKETNNDFAKANKIKLKKTYVGALGETTADYFKVKTAGGGKYKVSVKLSKDVRYGYNIKVYDSSRTLVASSKKKVYKNGSLKFRAKGHKKYYVVLEHGDVGFFTGGRCLGTLYKLKVAK